MYQWCTKRTLPVVVPLYHHLSVIMSILAFLKNAQTLLFLIIAGGFLTCNFSCGQIVTVNMQPSSSNPVTASATLTCNFMVDDPTYAFFNLEWRIGSTLLADFFGGAENPDYKNYCSSSGLCAITRNNSQSNFVLSSVEMVQNEGTYRCQVTFDKGFHSVDGQDTAYLTIVVPTANITLSNASSSEAFNEGAEVELSIDVANYIFKCEVPGINPQATFTWTVGGQPLPSESINEDHVVGVDGLTRSISNATLAPKLTYDNQTLMCKAVNYNGDPGVMISVTLTITVPPNPSTMFLTHDDMRYKDGDSINVIACSRGLFSCTVPGIKPKAEIFVWTLGSNVLSPESNPTSVPNQVDSRLYDTTSALTLTVPDSNTTLMCAATNRQDGKTESSISITLVKVHTKLIGGITLMCVGGVFLISIGIGLIIVYYMNNKRKWTVYKQGGISIGICVGVVLVIIGIVFVVVYFSTRC